MPSVSQIGKLKNQITIQNTDLTTDTYGGYTKANTTFVTACASIRPKTGKEIWSDKTGQQIENPHTYQFKIRYRANITTSMRILWGTRTFKIITIDNENDYNNYITIIAVEDVAT